MNGSEYTIDNTMTASDSKIRYILEKIQVTEEELHDFIIAAIRDVLIPFPETGLGLPWRMQHDERKLRGFIKEQRQFVESNGKCLDEAVAAPDGYKSHFHLSDHVIIQHYFNVHVGVGAEVSVWGNATCNRQKLDKGGFSTVYKVPIKPDLEMNRPHREFVAMKWILRPRRPLANFLEDDDRPKWKWLAHIGKDDRKFIYPDIQQRYFEAEVDILRKIREISAQEPKWNKLKDDHIIKIRTSFTDPEAFGILLSPVGYFSLEKLLGSFSDGRDSITDPDISGTTFRRDQLLSCMGCLASSVMFLHKFNIRHKDIKTKNILVYPSNDVGTSTDWKICLCDFATAVDYSPNPESLGETTGPVVRPLTRHYEAPETIAQNPGRTIAEDMWHLGCVFLEILLVSRRKTKIDLNKIEISPQEAFSSRDSLRLYDTYFQRGTLRRWLKCLESGAIDTDVISWVQNLLVSPFSYLRRSDDYCAIPQSITPADFEATFSLQRIRKNV